MENKQIHEHLRDVFFERFTSENGKRKSLQMTEIIERDGYLARAQKRFNYYISEKKGAMKGSKALKKWAKDTHDNLMQKPRHVSISRVFDDNTGIGHTTCRQTGSFYLMKDGRVFAVAFLHSVKFDILGSLA